MKIKTCTLLLLPLLMMPSIQATAETPAPQPPAMVPILPPELPESTSLEETLRQTPTEPSPKAIPGYSLGTPKTPAYLDLHRDDLHQEYLTPQWELFRWKSSPDNR